MIQYRSSVIWTISCSSVLSHGSAVDDATWGIAYAWRIPSIVVYVFIVAMIRCVVDRERDRDRERETERQRERERERETERQRIR